MAKSFSAQAELGSFVPTTNIWDPSEIYSTEVTSPEFKELMVRLYQNLNNMALSLNTRDAGYYDRQEFVCGQLFFPNPSLSSTTPQVPESRQVFRKVINFGALPTAAASPKQVAHGLTVTSGFSFTRIYGCATNPSTSFLPLPYTSSSATSNNIELFVDGTNVSIAVGIDRNTYTTSYIVLEFIKQ